jgi:aryl-alcohol dehydrogenase-like predicted oxidoreductase
MSDARLPEAVPGARRPFGRIGFGGYRVDDRTPTHRAALERALDAGCTLIDTSTNYTDGGSESLVGAVLSERERRSPGSRGKVVVVSKIGYVQGANLDLAIERERRGAPFPEMVRYMDGCWHCIHPEFLADQLSRSLARLQAERFDVCLLHNPEYFLSDAAHRGGGDLEGTRAEFYRRIQAAFVFLEEQVRRGVLGAYGVSSNSVVTPADGPETTSLARFLDAARAAGGDRHHFRVVQWPMNLFEGGAVLEPNTGPAGARTALETARDAGLAVLVNRPLNAILEGRLLRLSDASPAARAIAEHLDPLLPLSLRSATLSRKAIAVLLSTPGIATVLVGMRRPAWVDDTLGTLDLEPVPDPAAVYRKFSELTAG